MSGPIITLSMHYQPITGEDDGDDADGWPLSHFNFAWLTVEQLSALARDLDAAVAAGHDGRRVLQAWRRADLDGLLRSDDDEVDT